MLRSETKRRLPLTTAKIFTSVKMNPSCATLFRFWNVEFPESAIPNRFSLEFSTPRTMTASLWTDIHRRIYRSPIHERRMSRSQAQFWKSFQTQMESHRRFRHQLQWACKKVFLDEQLFTRNIVQFLFSLDAFVHGVIAINFLCREPHIHVETLILRLANQKLHRKWTSWVAACTCLQHKDISLTEGCRNVVRKSQVRKQACLINWIRKGKNSSMVELRHFLYIVHELKEET